MAILIKGMGMPHSEVLTIRIFPNGEVHYIGEACQSARRAEAVEIPPHGRLIDADELAGLCDIMADKCGGIGESIWGQFRETVEWSPTIIESEGRE